MSDCQFNGFFNGRESIVTFFFNALISVSWEYGDSPFAGNGEKTRRLTNIKDNIFRNFSIQILLTKNKFRDMNKKTLPPPGKIANLFLLIKTIILK
jgi:hypothetical protein